MDDINLILERIYNNLTLTLAGCGFVPEYPEGTESVLCAPFASRECGHQP